MKFTKFSFVVLFVLCCAFLIPGVVSAAPVYNPANGHYYELFNDPMGISWTNANIAAQGMSYNGAPGHLVTITSAEEYNFIFDNFFKIPYLIGGPGCWLGGHQTVGASDPASGWQWVTGESWSYDHWHPTQGPDDGTDNGGTRIEETELFMTIVNGYWWDYQSDFIYWLPNGYIVEYEPMAAPEFPSTLLPATMIIGFLGAVLLIQRTREK